MSIAWGPEIKKAGGADKCPASCICKPVPWNWAPQVENPTLPHGRCCRWGFLSCPYTSAYRMKTQGKSLNEGTPYIVSGSCSFIELHQHEISFQIELLSLVASVYKSGLATAMKLSRRLCSSVSLGPSQCREPAEQRQVRMRGISCLFVLPI